MNTNNKILVEQIYDYQTINNNRLIRGNLAFDDDMMKKLKEISNILNSSMTSILIVLIDDFINTIDTTNEEVISYVLSYKRIKSNLHRFNLSIDEDKYKLLEEICKQNNISRAKLYCSLINYIYKQKDIITDIIIEKSNLIISIYSIYLFNYKKYIVEFSKKKPFKNKKPRKKAITSKEEYINFKYKQKELNIIDSCKLSKKDMEIVNELKIKYKDKQFYPIVQDLYILYIKAEYSSVDIGQVYDRNERVFQIFFKENGLSRNLFEAQQIAKKKRDYKQIMNKGRETMMKNQTSLKGSKQEVYTRDYINCKLPLEIPNSEIIVGVNNKSILDDGKEIDIPIIIINNDKIYKFAIEYNGDFWHENENRESIKLEMINNKGYHLFYIAPKTNASNKQIKEYIEEQIDTIIIPYIKQIINKGEIN